MGTQLISKALFSVGVVVVGGLFATFPVKAEWACEVALCLSNPSGPIAVSQCAPPITELYEQLAKGRAFPLCRSADGHVNFTRYGMERWERCSDGSRARQRIDYDSGRLGGGVCNVFVPSGSGGPCNEDDNCVFETRWINGQSVWGEVVEEDAVARSRPLYLDYVVEGQSQRIWF